MESSIAVFLMRQSACERLPTTFGASEHHYGEAIVTVLFPLAECWRDGLRNTRRCLTARPWLDIAQLTCVFVST